MLSGSGVSSLLVGLYASVPAPKAPVNAPPTMAQPISVNGNASVTGKSAALSVLGSDDGGESKLTYTWSVTTAPTGGNATFLVNGTNAAKNDAVTFTKAGTYSLTVKIVDAGGLSVSSVKSVTVLPTLASIRLTTPSGLLVSPTSPLTVSAASQTLVAQGLDQFGNALATTPSFTWSMTATPSGAPRVGLATSGSNDTLTFGKAGTYGLAVQGSAGGVSVASNVSLTVAQVISALHSPATTPVAVSGTSLQLAVATFIDQFGNALVTPPALTWSVFEAPQVRRRSLSLPAAASPQPLLAWPAAIIWTAMSPACRAHRLSTWSR